MNVKVPSLVSTLSHIVSRGKTRHFYVNLLLLKGLHGKKLGEEEAMSFLCSLSPHNEYV
jgi:hypothetical protein